ncbi:uncharacterized protein [Argopecten irradians]|uniref:uncharacterized protein n=1 Tax=Argopecten irradians TaxID=31199 RepID=UPI003711A289
MATAQPLFAFLFVGLLGILSAFASKDKRILVSDPGYIQNELHQIQVKLQEYEATKILVTGLSAKVSSQENEISQLKYKLSSVETEMSSLQQLLNASTKSVAVMQAELAGQDSQINSLQSQISADKSNIISLQAVVNANSSVISTQLAAQEATISNLENQIHNTQGVSTGAVYIRWGRRDCPADNSTHLVYTGYAGGSNSAHTGGAAEMVCLPSDPTWGPHKEIEHYNPAYMYGAEYEDALLFGMPNQDEDVPCAVCRSTMHSTSLMIPAREQCYSGWTEGYHGVLSSGSVGSPSPTQYVCVDEHPQALTGGGITNSEGRLLYQVRTVCGSLQCPPYEDDKVLSCVVCLK